MEQIRFAKTVVNRLLCIVLASLLLAAGLFHSPGVNAAPQVLERSIVISDSRPSQIAEYRTRFLVATPGLVGSVMIEFCGNTALPEEVCIPPTGFDAGNTVIAAYGSGPSSSLDEQMSTSNVLVITNGATYATGDPIEYQLNAILNPSVPGSYFARFSTFASADASGSPIDQGSVAMYLTEDVTIKTEVPPYLTFCVGTQIDGTDCTSAQGNFIDVGVLSPNRAASGTIGILAATNAANGYAVRITGNTLSSGNNILTPLARPTSSAPGTNQFGVNLRANSNPSVGNEPSGPGQGVAVGDYGQSNLYTYRSGDVVAASPTPDDYRRYTMSYLLNVSQAQPAGVYNSTFTYIGLASF